MKKLRIRTTPGSLPDRYLRAIIRQGPYLEPVPITRFEVIDNRQFLRDSEKLRENTRTRMIHNSMDWHYGRNPIVLPSGNIDITYQLQDDGQTLKVFLTDKEE